MSSLASCAGEAGAATAELSEQSHDVAYLDGGPEVVVLSALSSMRVGTIVTEGRGWVRAGAPLSEATDELERAIHLAAVVSIDRRELATHRIVNTALESARRRLQGAGLRVSAGMGGFGYYSGGGGCGGGCGGGGG